MSSRGDRQPCRRIPRWLRAAALSIVFVFGSTGSSGAEVQTKQAADGMIAFTQEPATLLGEEIYSVPVGGGTPLNVTRAPGDDRSPLVSPDGTKIAYLRYGSSGSDLYVVDADGGNVRRLIPVEPARPGFDLGFSWAPDSQRIAVIRETRVSILDLRTGELVEVATEAEYPSWSPDGRRIAFTRPFQFEPRSGLYVVDLDTRVETQLLAGKEGSEPIWSPTGRRILLDNMVVDVDTGSAKLLSTLTGHGHSPWSPDGERLVLTSGPTLLMFDVATGTTRPLGSALPGVESAAWSHDGRFIAANLSGGRVVVLREDGGRERILELGRYVGRPRVAWSPDDSRFVFSGGRRDDAELFVMREDGTGVRRLTNNSVWEREPVWSPNGREIAFIRSSRDSVEGPLFRMRADGTSLRRISRTPVFGAAWSPDGKTIIAASLSQARGVLDVRFSSIDASSGHARVLWRRRSECGVAGEDLAWSARARRIAYTDFMSTCRRVIRLVRPDGGGRSIVVTGGRSVAGGDVGGPKGAFGPAWSHDGRLAFVSLLDLGNVGLYDVDLRVARSDGSRPVVVSRIPGQICSAGGPSWVPEGKRLVWSVEPCDAQYPTLRVVTVSTGAMRTVGFGRDPDWRKANG